MDQTTPITVTLSLGDWNYIVSVLAQRSFAEVGTLIPAIQYQAAQQVPAEALAPVQAPVAEAEEKTAE